MSITMNISASWSGDDPQQIDAAIAEFCRPFLDALDAGHKVEIGRSSKTSREFRVLLENMPLQMTVEDAEKVRSLLLDLTEFAPGPATLALEIIDAAILLR